VGIAFVNSAIFWHCRLRWFTLRLIKSHMCSIGTWQSTGMCQLPLTAWILLQCDLCAGWCYRQPIDDYQNGVQRSTLSPLRLPCKTCKSNLQLKEKHPRQLHCLHWIMLYPSCPRHEMQWFYTTRLKRRHPREAIKIYFCLTKWLIPTEIVTWSIPSIPPMM
jgi:hypothetical protein